MFPQFAGVEIQLKDPEADRRGLGHIVSQGLNYIITSQYLMIPSRRSAENSP